MSNTIKMYLVNSARDVKRIDEEPTDWKFKYYIKLAHSGEVVLCFCDWSVVSPGLLGGVLHRTDGPAAIISNRSCYFFIEGKQLRSLDEIKETTGYTDEEIVMLTLSEVPLETNEAPPYVNPDRTVQMEII